MDAPRKTRFSFEGAQFLEILSYLRIFFFLRILCEIKFNEKKNTLFSNDFEIRIFKERYRFRSLTSTDLSPIFLPPLFSNSFPENLPFRGANRGRKKISGYGRGFLIMVVGESRGNFSAV